MKCKLNYLLVIIMSAITAVMSSFFLQVFQHSRVFHDHHYPATPSHTITP